MKKINASILGCALQAAALILGLAACPAWAAERQRVAVSEVLTGDTLRLEGGKLFRYIGLRSPAPQSKIPLLRQYGAEALGYHKSLVSGKTLLVEWDDQIYLDARTLLGYAYLEDGTFLNEALIRAGHAKAAPAAPNLRHAAAFRKAQLEARRAKRGLWREEPDNPYLMSEYVGEKNTKIYYFPDSPELERIPEAQLVRFRSRVEAKAAGYRPCHGCREQEESESN